jgi:hypothetical protein
MQHIKRCILFTVHLYASLHSWNNQRNCIRFICVMEKHLVFCDVKSGILNFIEVATLNGWTGSLTATHQTRNCRLPNVLKTLFEQ